MKFGGTSVQDATSINRVVDIVSNKLSRRPVVVVSAMARTTDTLIQIGRLAAAGQLKEAGSLIDSLFERHIDVARLLLNKNSDESQRLIYKLVELKLIECFTEIRNEVKRVASIASLKPESQDAIVSQGERLSSLIVEAAFRFRGLPSELVDSRSFIITDNGFTQAVVNRKESRSRICHKLVPIVEAGRVAVAQGFIGSTAEGKTTTIGRGGSDYSAAIIGAALDAEAVEIWTDVDGIMTADPRVCADARCVPSISYDEAMELSRFGAKVLHPQTVLPAIECSMPVYVYNSFNPSCEGTLVARDPDVPAFPVKSIAMKSDITLIRVSIAETTSVSLSDKAFDEIIRLSLAVDVSKMSASVITDSADKVGSIVAALKKFGQVTVEMDKTAVCMVGDGITAERDLASRLLDRLSAIRIDQTYLMPSDINLAFVVESSDAERLVQQLHCELFIEQKPLASFVVSHEDCSSATASFIGSDVVSTESY